MPRRSFNARSRSSNITYIARGLSRGGVDISGADRADFGRALKRPPKSPRYGLSRDNNAAQN